MKFIHKCKYWKRHFGVPAVILIFTLELFNIRFNKLSFMYFMSSLLCDILYINLGGNLFSPQFAFVQITSRMLGNYKYRSPNSAEGRIVCISSFMRYRTLTFAIHFFFIVLEIESW